MSVSHALELITLSGRRERGAQSLGASGSLDRRTGDGEARSSLPEGASRRGMSSVAYRRLSHIIILAVAFTFSYSLAQAGSSSAPGQIKIAGLPWPPHPQVSNPRANVDDHSRPAHGSTRRGKGGCVFDEPVAPPSAGADPLKGSGAGAAARETENGDRHHP